MHFGAWMWISFQRSLCFAFLQTQPRFPEPNLFCWGLKEISATFGGPHSHTQVARRGNHPEDTGWPAGHFCPQPHQLLYHFLGSYRCRRSDHDFFPPLFAPGCFLCCLTEPHLQPSPPAVSFLVPMLQIPCWSNIKLPEDKVLKTLSHPFLLFPAHFGIIDLESRYIIPK